MKKELKLPKFKNEDEERDFWSKIDLTDYLDVSDFEPVTFPNLKPTTNPISIRFPQHLLSRVKQRANALDVPYQSLIKMYVADRIKDDMSKEYKAV
jgi:predicted DNA binding CopG/RHH family protein